MEERRFEEYLFHFGLTRQEAAIYQRLLLHGKQTGYEIAKETGISRSNVYGALAALVEKGAAYLVEETAKKYIPVRLEEFCENCIRRMQEEKDWMIKNLPRETDYEEGYITIEGTGNIRNKIKNLLQHVKERVYISCAAACLEDFREELEELLHEKKKVVVITDAEMMLYGALLYHTEEKGRQIGVIVDSRYAISGEYEKNGTCTCLYSGQKNFVELFKNALANEIKLIKLNIPIEIEKGQMGRDIKSGMEKEKSEIEEKGLRKEHE